MSTTSPRARKPTLKRDKPIRTWSKAFGGTAGKVAEKNGAVTDGVRLGYRVIDEYLTRGQEAARTFGGAGGETLKAASNEVQRLTQQMFQYASDLASAWMELLQTLTASGLPSDDATGPGQTQRVGREPPDEPDASDQPCSFSLQVDSRLPTEIAVDLRRRALENPIEVQPLVCQKKGSARITGVTIKASPTAGRAVVKVRVPPSQLPGLYRGLIIDGSTNLPCGTLAVRVGSREESSA